MSFKECETCKAANKSGKLSLKETTTDFFTFRCSLCGKTTPFIKAFSDEIIKMWLPKVAIKKQIAAYWYFARGDVPSDVAPAIDVSLPISQQLYLNFVKIVAPAQEIANNDLVIGGKGIECEADEIAFRNVRQKRSKKNAAAEQLGSELPASADAVPENNDDEDDCELVWLRYIGIVRRGSSRIFLEKLEDRAVQGSGQGGGGALSHAELKKVLRPDSQPRLLPESILHTDSAKAYRKLGATMRRPAPGSHHEAFEEESDYRHLKYAHTNVTHKKKVGERIRYVLKRTVTIDGTEREVLAGTQKIDGYWATMRREVGKRAVQTGATAASEKRKRLHQLVRVHQWHYWHQDADRFALFAALWRNVCADAAAAAAAPAADVVPVPVFGNK